MLVNFHVTALALGLVLSAAAVAAAADSPSGPQAAGEQITPAKNLPLSAGELRATSLFHVGRRLPHLLENSERADTDKEWDVFCRTQLAYLRSYFVIQSALRSPGVAQLKLIADKPDPVQWLIDHLESGFDGDSEIMFISLRGPEASSDDLRQIVDAVSDAYLKEVVFEEEQRRLVVKDALQRSLSTLMEEIHNKMDERNALAEELGFYVQAGSPDIHQRIDLRRLERIDDELLRLEGEQLSAKLLAEEREGDVQPRERAQLKYLDERIAQLHERQAELEKQISVRNNSSVELAIENEELSTLKGIASDMSVQLERMDVEDVAPDRVRRIQKATPTRSRSTN